MICKIIFLSQVLKLGETLSTAFFESLEKEGFIKKKSVNILQIANLPIKKLIDFANESSETTALANLKENREPFSFSSSLSISGSAQPCMALRCRAGRAARLAQYAGTPGNERLLIWANDKLLSLLENLVPP